MKVTTNLNRKDLLYFCIYSFPRIKSNWFLFILIGLMLSVYFLYKAGIPFTEKNILIGFLCGYTGAFIGIAVGFIFNTACVLFMATGKSGILGVHTLEITDKGILEKTQVNESIHTWDSIQALGRTKNYIYIRLHSFQFHIIPCRDFPSPDEAAQYYKLLESKISG